MSKAPSAPTIGLSGWGQHATACGREKGIVSSFPASGPVFRWQVPIGAGYASPAVVGDRVYITDACWRLARRIRPVPSHANMVDGKEGICCLDDKTGEVICGAIIPALTRSVMPRGHDARPSSRTDVFTRLARWATCTASMRLPAK